MILISSFVAFCKKEEEGGKTETEKKKQVGQMEQKAFKTPTVSFEDERLRIKYKKGCSRLARLTTWTKTKMGSSFSFLLCRGELQCRVLCVSKQKLARQAKFGYSFGVYLSQKKESDIS